MASSAPALFDVAGAALDRLGAPRPFATSAVPVGASNTVFRVEDANGMVHAVRISRHKPGRLAAERRAMVAAAAAGVPVPTVRFAGDVDVEDELHTVLVSEWIDGTRLGGLGTLDGDRRSELTDAAASVLAAIHSIEVSGFGNLDADLASAWPTFAAWFVDAGRAGLTTSLEAAKASAPDLVPLLTRAGATLEAAAPLLPVEKPHLAHGDFSPNNLLVVGSRIVAVLDWESVKGGPAALDFGWWDFVGGAAVLPTGDLVRAYRAISGQALDGVDELRRLVRIRVLIGHLAWCVRTGNRESEGSLATDLAAALERRPT